MNTPSIFKCGGCIAMYKLFHDLRSLGEEVYLSEKPKQTIPLPGLQDNLVDSDFLTEGWNDKGEIVTDKDLSDYVAIYPEVTTRNPLKSKRVVRWLLHYPGFHNWKVPSKWNPDSELYFAYADWIAEGTQKKYGFEIANRLTTIYNNFDVFKNYNDPERSGSCYITRKGNAGYRDPLPDGAVSVEAETLSDDAFTILPKIFNKYENLYSYDEDTYLLVLAALCGCNSIIISRSKKNEEEYFSSRSPVWSAGIAYGADKINHAKETKHLVKERLEELEKDSLNTVRAFVNITKNVYSS